MTKKLLTIILFISIKVSAQQISADLPVLPWDSAHNIVVYTEIVTVDSALTKEELYNRAREFFAVKYKSANDVIQLDDKLTGKIIAKGSSKVFTRDMGMVKEAGYMHHTFKIETKNGRYRYEIKDLRHVGTIVRNGYPDFGPIENMYYGIGKGWWLQRSLNQIMNCANDDITDLIIELKKALSAPIARAGSDW
jgi:hypothetical protein